MSSVVLSRPYSIRKSILSFLLASAVIITAFLAALSQLEWRQGRAQLDFIGRIAKVGEVFLRLDAMDRLMSEYMHSWQEAQREAYLDASGRLEEVLDDLDAICAGEQPTLNYLRRIRAFNEYQTASVTPPWATLAEHYASLSFIKTAIGSHRAHAQELAHSDLILTRRRYEQEQGRFLIRRLSLWGGLILLLLLSGVHFYLRFKGISAAMREMRANLQLLALKKWNAPDLEFGNYAELSDVAAAINEMKRVIGDHIVRMEEHARLERQLDSEKLENERKERMLVEAQMSILKAQINPHFLFNTLNIIGKTALLREPEQAMELIEATAKILRYSLQTADRRVAVRDEVDIVETYLFLQKARFGTAFTYEMRVDESLWEVRVQSMLVQPVIENCFKHGFDGRSTLHIVIEARDVGDDMEFVVEDDGKGFDAAATSADGGIGLANIRRRIELEYGVADPVAIDSVPGEGVRIRIRIPKRSGAAS